MTALGPVIRFLPSYISVEVYTVLGTSVNRYEWLTVLTVNLANGVASFDTGVMNLILPTISITLKAPVEIVFWVPLVALISRAAFMPSIGRYSDIHGRKKLMLAGLIVFAAGSFLSGISTTIYELIIYRIIQGIGAASILAVGRAIIVNAVGRENRGYALGTNVSTIYLATTLGTAISGTIISFTSYVGWEQVFIVTGIATVAIIPLTFFALKDEGARSTNRSMDWTGSFLLAAAIGATLSAVTAGVLTNFGTLRIFIEYIRIPIIDFYIYTLWSFSIPVSWIAFAAIAFTALFFIREYTAERPLLDFRLFTSNITFSITNLTAFVTYIGTYSLLILLSFYLEVIRGFTPLVSGLLLALQPMAVTVFAIIGGRLSRRYDNRHLEFSGLLIMVVCLLLLGGTSVNTSVILTSLLLIGLGAGFGIFSPNNTNLNLSSVKEEDRSLANGVLGMMRHSGQTISLGVATIALDISLFGITGSGSSTFNPLQYIHSLDISFFIGAGLIIFASLLYIKYHTKIGRPVAPEPGVT